LGFFEFWKLKFLAKFSEFAGHGIRAGRPKPVFGKHNLNRQKSQAVSGLKNRQISENLKTQ